MSYKSPRFVDEHIIDLIQRVRKLERRRVFDDVIDLAGLTGGSGGGQIPTLLIAASDATDDVKAVADFICDGTDDQEEMIAALDLLPVQLSGLFRSGRILLSEGNFYNTDVVLPVEAFLNQPIFQGMGETATVIHTSHSGTGLQFNAVFMDFRMISDAGAGLGVGINGSGLAIRCRAESYATGFLFSGTLQNCTTVSCTRGYHGSTSSKVSRCEGCIATGPGTGTASGIGYFSVKELIECQATSYRKGASGCLFVKDSLFSDCGGTTVTDPAILMSTEGVDTFVRGCQVTPVNDGFGIRVDADNVRIFHNEFIQSGLTMTEGVRVSAGADGTWIARNDFRYGGIVTEINNLGTNTVIEHNLPSSANVGNPTLDFGEVGDISSSNFSDTALAGATGEVADAGHRHAREVNPVPGHEAAADPHTGYVLESLLDAKGDLYVASADNTPDNLTVGADGQVLTADSGQALGVKWAAPASGGHTIEENGTPLTARTGLNFVEGLVATDDAGNDETDVNADWATTEIADIGTVESAGASTKVPRADHVHVHPVIASGDLHPEYLTQAEGDAAYLPITGVVIEDEGIVQGDADTLNFVGAGVTAVVAAGEATITIAGGSGSGDTLVAWIGL